MEKLKTRSTVGNDDASSSEDQPKITADVQANKLKNMLKKKSISTENYPFNWAFNNLDTNNINIETINNSVKDLGFKFVSRQEWIDSLPDQEEKDNVPPTNNSPLGFSYAGYNYHTDDICFMPIEITAKIFTLNGEKSVN